MTAVQVITFGPPLALQAEQAVAAVDVDAVVAFCDSGLDRFRRRLREQDQPLPVPGKREELVKAARGSRPVRAARLRRCAYEFEPDVGEIAPTRKWEHY